MLLAPLGHGVGEEGEIPLGPGGVFDFEIDGPGVAGTFPGGEQQIDAAAAAFPVGNLRLDGANRPKPGLQASGLDRGAHQGVGEGCVDPHPELVALGAKDLGLLPGPGQLAGG